MTVESVISFLRAATLIVIFGLAVWAVYVEKFQ